MARIDAATSRIEDFGSDLQIELALSHAVPWRIFTLDEPRRLVADFGEVEFDGAALAGLVQSDEVKGVTYGRYREGWSRLVLVLASPMRVETAGVGMALEPVGSASLKMSLAPTSESEFAASTGAPEGGIFHMPMEVLPAGQNKLEDQTQRLRVLIDAGSGLSATRGSNDPLLTIARELAAGLVRDGHDAALTKHMPVPSLSSDRGETDADMVADVVLSLKVDPEASEPFATETIAEGILKPPLQSVSSVPSEAAPRGERLAAQLVDSFTRHTDDVLTAPRIRAGFSVREQDEVPSVRVELGFAGGSAERANLYDPIWRTKAVLGIREAFEVWAEKDAGASDSR